MRAATRRAPILARAATPRGWPSLLDGKSAGLSRDRIPGDVSLNDESFLHYRAERIAYWNQYERTRAGIHYRQRLAEIYSFVVPSGQRVLEVGCGCGDLLAALEPSYGVGIDFSQAMVERASQSHPELRFHQADAHEFACEGTFDYIILSDLVNDLWDVQQVLERVHALCGPQTRIVINTYSRAWELPLAVARRLRLANPVPGHNWLTREDLSNLLTLAGFEVIRVWQEILWPLKTPPLDTLLNRYLAKLPLFRQATLTNFMVARPVSPSRGLKRDEPLVSVIVPARNEAGNIESIMRRVPEMGAGTEIVFVEGHSHDNTFETIEQEIARHPERRCKLVRQSGKGKGDAVRMGFASAAGEILMILDADLTVPPEDLPRFYRALHSGTGEFVNGVRLVYPMEDQAMRFANLLGNKFFSFAFSWLLGQRIKDTLCGTKVLSRANYEKIAANRSFFGDFDPFGDFDLIFGASRLNLRMVDLPVRYRSRVYGETNIHRWRHGWLLLKMVAFASRRIKFV